MSAPAIAPRVRFGLPDGFSSLDVTEDPLARADRTLATLRRRLPEVTGPQAAYFVTVQQAMIDSMIAAGVRYAATCVALGDGPEPRLTVAQFTVSVVAGDAGGARTLEHVGAGLPGGATNRATRVVDLPAGPALVVAEDRSVVTASTVLGEPSNTEHRVRQIQLVVPFPDRRQLAIFALATEALDDWDEYTDIMAAIARTIAFPVR